MPAFQFVHTADLHLDSPFQGLATVAPALQPILREATFQAFDRIIDLCITREVQFLLIAGDIHDATDRSLRALTRLRNGFERLAEHHIPAFVCHGNHDPLTGWSERFVWPDTVHVFHAQEVAAKPVEVNGLEIARIYGISYGMEKVTDNLALQFHKEVDAPWSVGLLHTNVSNDPNHGNYAPCQLDNLLHAGMDYWALGHVHTHCILRHQNPLIIYPGNPQGRHVRETGPRGCYLVAVDPQGCAHPEFVPVDVVRWFNERLTIEGLKDFNDLLGRLDERVHALRQQTEGRGALVRWQLEGRGIIHRALGQPGRLEDLLVTLQERWGMDSPFVWSESLHDRTGREINMTVLRQDDNLLGDFLRLADGRVDDTRLQELRHRLNPLFGDPRVYRHLGTPSDAQILDWIVAAQHLGIDRLLMEDK